MAPKLEQRALAAFKAMVRVNQKDAGYLERIASDEYRFSYLDSYLQTEDPPVSLTLPKRKAPYISETLHPFFDNLLFEGEQLILVEKRFGLKHQSNDDRFKLLMITGQNTLGAVTVFPIIEGLPVDLSKNLSLKHDFKTQILELEAAYKNYCTICLKIESKGMKHAACLKSLWGSKKTVRIEVFQEEPQNTFQSIVLGQSISGVQRKALFGLNSENILKREGMPTHILKPDGYFPEMPANEHLTMSIAKQLKFNVAVSGLYRIEKVGLVYVTKRFDIDTSGNKYAIEDMAQLGEELAEDKDRASLNNVVEIINSYASSPILESAELFRRLLFCFLIANGDMHLKNWALCYRLPSGLTKLAPVYDFLNVRASYPQEQVESILPLNGKQNNLTRSDFEVFAKDTLKLNKNFIGKTMSELPHWMKVIEDFSGFSLLSDKMKIRYRALARERFERLYKG